MWRLILAALMIVAGAAGFVGANRLFLDDDSLLASWRQARRSAPVDVTLAFSARQLRALSTGRGWGRPDNWGIAATDKTAEVLVHLTADAGDDLMLWLEGRAASPTRIDVQVAGQSVGIWLVAPSSAPAIGRFIVQRALANKAQPVAIALVAQAPGLQLHRLVLRDARAVSASYKGAVDNCTPNRVAGWAVAGDMPSPLTLRVNGSPMPAALQGVTRPDLPEHGLPATAGFELSLPEPASADGRFEVLFPNGRPVANSPCRPS